VSVQLRLARPDDALAIATILSDWIDETHWMPRIHTRTEDRGFGTFLIERTDVTVATVHAGPIVGFLACRGGEVEALYVARENRGQGVGGALLAQARNAGGPLKLWTFQANGAARKFYRRAGFREIEFTDGAGNDEGLPDVRMMWNAAPGPQGSDVDNKEAAL
jgi:GNAT superfamily N-acetyltransferase